MRCLEARLNVEAKAPSSLDAAAVFTLDRMRRLLDELGHPERDYVVLHVAGSKGKGSVCEMVASGLAAAGVRTGLYTSPHLERINERIRIGGEEIGEAEFAEAVRTAHDAAVRIEAAADPVTFFELLTAAAFVHFRSRGVEAAVIETGLGGRDDATNVVSSSVTAITEIQLEHTHLLGKTPALIAKAKAGIMRPGVACVTPPQSADVMRVFREQALACGAMLEVLGDDLGFSVSREPSSSDAAVRVSVEAAGTRFEDVAVPFEGDHQAINCGLALAMLGRTRAAGLDFDVAHAAAGVSKALRRGRMELHAVDRGFGERLVCLDAAHTPDSIEALGRALQRRSRRGDIACIAGMAADKDVAGIMRAMAAWAGPAWFTAATGHRRAAEAGALLRSYEEAGGRSGRTAAGLHVALEEALSQVGPEGVVVVTGSHAIVGEGLGVLRGWSSRRCGVGPESSR